MLVNNLSKEWIKKNGTKIKVVYSYAVFHKLDISKIDDVLIILRAIYSKDANRKQAEMYVKVLQLFKDRFRKTVEELR